MDSEERPLFFREESESEFTRKRFFAVDGTEKRSTPKKPKNEPRKQPWTSRYVGKMQVAAFTLYRSSKMATLRRNETVTLQRPKVRPDASDKEKEKSQQVIRFRNAKGTEMGRISTDVASWLSPVIDSDLFELKASVSMVKHQFQSGDSLTLGIEVYIKRKAFQSLIPKRNGAIFKKDDVKVENDRLTQSSSFLKMFKKLGLKPSLVQTDSGEILDQKDLKRLLKKDDKHELTRNQLDLMWRSVLNRNNQASLQEKREPSTFSLELKKYQRQALHWMCSVENGDSLRSSSSEFVDPLWDKYIFPDDDEGSAFYFNAHTGEFSLSPSGSEIRSKGGILADEMGLGKTIMISSLIQTTREADDDIIVQPRSSENDALYSEDNETLVSNSHPQLEKQPTLIVAPVSLLSQWCSELQRSGKKGHQLKIFLYYGDNISTVKGDLGTFITQRKIDVVVTSYGIVASEYKRSEGKQSHQKLLQYKWYRVVLDEAHVIKSRDTINARSCYELQGMYKWCLTGTPIVNRLDDLSSLLHFIELEPWGQFSFFQNGVISPFEKGSPSAMVLLRHILKGVLLRREKSMTDENGNPLVKLPSKITHIDYLELSEEEQNIYNSAYEQAKNELEQYSARGTLMKNVTTIFSILMRLRQIVLYPGLLKRNLSNLIDNNGKESDKTLLKLVNRYLKGENVSSDTVLEWSGESDADDFRVENCVLCHDCCDNAVELDCGCYFCKECLSSFIEEQVETQTLKCPGCQRALNIIDKSVGVATVSDTERHILSEPPITLNSPLLLSQDNDDSDIEIVSFPPCTNDSIQIINEPEDDDIILEEPEERILSTNDATYVNDYVLKNTHFLSEEAALKGQRTSTKLEALIQKIYEIKEEDDTEKCVVFSQFTQFIDTIELVLKREKFQFVRIDGTLSQLQRAAVIDKFTATDGIILLASLRAAGVGLNLTTARHVILMDTWWNSAVERQAIDRVHRFGQTRTVHVTRFLIKGSIEDRMLQIQSEKEQVINGALGDDPANKKQLEKRLEVLFK